MKRLNSFSFWSNQDYSVGCDHGLCWQKLTKRLEHSVKLWISPHGIVGKMRISALIFGYILSSKLCWHFRKNHHYSIILNLTFFVSLKKQNCVKKNTHLNPQDPFLFNIFYLQFKRDRDTDHRVVDESQQKDLQSTHIFPRLRCLLLSCTKTIWWYTMASFLLKVFQAPLFLLKRSDFNGYHIACDWNWTGHVLLSFGRVYSEYIKQSII